MKRFALIVPVLLLSLPCLGPACLAAPGEGLCAKAIVAAEQAHAIPPRLLAAIARVESGRRDAETGATRPWPWTINLDGQGSFYDDKPQAIAAARFSRPRAAKSIDVGCMQISLTHHPDAFPDLETAFDPMTNVDYGARFLRELYLKTNSWAKAVELYHSATPEYGQPYRERVYAAWHEDGATPIDGQPFPLAAAWSATVGRPFSTMASNQAPARIIRQAAAPGGPPATVHTLEFYRSAPVRTVDRQQIVADNSLVRITRKAGMPLVAGLPAAIRQTSD